MLGFAADRRPKDAADYIHNQASAACQTTEQEPYLGIVERVVSRLLPDLRWHEVDIRKFIIPLPCGLLVRLIFLGFRFEVHLGRPTLSYLSIPPHRTRQ